jgi:hypothetical protein
MQYAGPSCGYDEDLKAELGKIVVNNGKLEA